MDELLTIENLEYCFSRAKESGWKYIALLISMKGFEKPEIIINPSENFDTKLASYKQAYDENLNHRFSKGIKIVGFVYGSNFDNIEWDLIGTYE